MIIRRSAFLLLVPLPTLATEGSASVDLLSWSIQTAGLLILVLGLFFALAALLNRLRHNPTLTRRMTLLETLPLSKTEKVCRVQFGDRIMVLGVTPGGITQLAEQSAEDTTTDVNQNSSFVRILERCRVAETKPS